ncbi:hypothetical protein B0H65DRAFT_444261 [Neurospora tetraspora]|uniref:Uncharacterized protein n=1 Tax=Neurospora tetraspora TaxID=94610 RepID=A0AAE0JBE5_9PEZI|nr:hypothetical protein B0H65DRAFT_444261 [Neurospora tetraspora]
MATEFGGLLLLPSGVVEMWFRQPVQDGYCWFSNCLSTYGWLLPSRLDGTVGQPWAVGGMVLVAGTICWSRPLQVGCQILAKPEQPDTTRQMVERDEAGNGSGIPSLGRGNLADLSQHLRAARKWKGLADFALAGAGDGAGASSSYNIFRELLCYAGLTAGPQKATHPQPSDDWGSRYPLYTSHLLFHKWASFVTPVGLDSNGKTKRPRAPTGLEKRWYTLSTYGSPGLHGMRKPLSGYCCKVAWEDGRMRHDGPWAEPGNVRPVAPVHELLASHKRKVAISKWSESILLS